MNAATRHRWSYNVPGHAHELTFGCFHGFQLLKSDRTSEWLADSIRAACEELNVVLWAYVFMPSRVILIIHPLKSPYDIAEFLKKVKDPAARRGLAWLRREPPAWLRRIQQIRGQKTEYHFDSGAADSIATSPRRQLWNA